MKSEAHLLLEIHLKELGIEFESEFAFHPTRRWRFDYLIGHPLGKPQYWIAIEIEGGIFSRNPGRHTRGKGYENDLEKYREATALGYKVYRFSTDEV